MLNNKYIILKKLLMASVVMGALVLFVVAMISNSMMTVKTEQVVEVVIPKANANEIYPEFVCGCCGKALDPKKICCGMMKNLIDYIDKQTEGDLAKDQIMINTIKEFGFNTLAKEETKKHLKNELAQKAPADAPKIIFDNKSFDFGVIRQKDGVVSTEIDFRNEGKTDLIINKITTSCGCTSASVIYNGVEGPTFTMPGHGKENPTDWSISIKPGSSAQVKVYYDPNVHGVQKEKELNITRTVDIFSNDPVDFEKQVRIELRQIP